MSGWADKAQKAESLAAGLVHADAELRKVQAENQQLRDAQSVLKRDLILLADETYDEGIAKRLRAVADNLAATPSEDTE